MRPLVLIPTYNERDNLKPLIDALMAIDGLRALIVDDNSPDGTGDVAEGPGRSQPRPRIGDPPARSSRAGTLLHRRHGGGAAHRRHAHLPDGRRPLARSGRASGFPRRHWPRGSGHRVALHPRRSAATLAGPSPDAQQVRELVHPRRSRGFRCTTAPAAFAAGGAIRWRACRSTASSPTAMRFLSNWPVRGQARWRPHR